MLGCGSSWKWLFCGEYLASDSSFSQVSRQHGHEGVANRCVGFRWSTIAIELRKESRGIEIIGFDKLSRRGSESNRHALDDIGIKFRHGDVRSASDIDSLPACDFVIDAAANPSVLAGVDGQTNSRQVIEHNLGGTINLLEYCKRHTAGFILLSTSRVYSISALAAIPVAVKANAFLPSGGNISGLTQYRNLPKIFDGAAVILLRNIEDRVRAPCH